MAQVVLRSVIRVKRAQALFCNGVNRVHDISSQMWIYSSTELYLIMNTHTFIFYATWRGDDCGVSMKSVPRCGPHEKTSLNNTPHPIAVPNIPAHPEIPRCWVKFSTTVSHSP